MAGPASRSQRCYACRGVKRSEATTNSASAIRVLGQRHHYTEPIGLAASPGTEVLPTCSMRMATSDTTGQIRARSFSTGAAIPRRSRRRQFGSPFWLTSRQGLPQLPAARIQVRRARSLPHPTVPILLGFPEASRARPVATPAPAVTAMPGRPGTRTRRSRTVSS